jgi:hypothetical protein
MTTKTASASAKALAFEALYDAADLAGANAAAAVTPVPMIVGSPTTPLGNDIDYSKPVWRIDDGVCGFAWIKVTPGTSAFARWLKAEKGERKSYTGGVDIWVAGYGQSMQRKEAYARAFAGVLSAAGIQATPFSRMD